MEGCYSMHQILCSILDGKHMTCPNAVFALVYLPSDWHYAFQFSIQHFI